jgi:hypothetical protein
LLAVIAGIVPIAAERAGAVILYRSEQRNLTAPTGAFTNSGWQLQGQYGAFLGTPIAPHYFITANHIGGAASVPLVFQGHSYFGDTTFNGGQGGIRVPGTDLHIWKTIDAFPTWAPLYSESADGPLTGKVLIDYGRGLQRGAPIYGEVTTNTGSDAGKAGELKGWGWGPEDGLMSWGTNVITGALNGGPDFGTVVTFDFDRNGLPEEGMLITGDSGGSAFVQGAGGVWKLAGINSAADGAYRVAAPVAGIDVNATYIGPLFDEGGLYESIGNNQYEFHPETAADQPGTSYLSSISHNLAFIQSIIGNPPTIQVPEPAAATLLTAASVALLTNRRFRITAGRRGC